MVTEFNVRSYGAVGDGFTNDAPAIQATIDACAAAGGGRVLVPAGKTFLSGTFTLKSNVELYIERGATIAASGNEADYRTAQMDPPPRPISPHSVAGSIALITAYRAENIAIRGGGVIDGGGRKFILTDSPYIYRMKPQRPLTLFFVGCSNITMQDVVVRDGAYWTLRFSGCEDILIQGIRIQNDLKLPNSDGIDLDHCRNVRINGCSVIAGDDCICLKTCADAGSFGACENVTVTNCTLMSTSCALMVGCEAHAPMRNVIFDSCVIQSSHRGLGIHLSHECDIENILFTNMIVETRLFDSDWWGAAEAIYLCAMPWTEQDQVGHIRNVRFSNILSRGENGVFIWGHQQDTVQDIVLDNVRVEIVKWSKWAAGRQDIRPCPGEGLRAYPNSGVFINKAQNVTLRNCQVLWAGALPDKYHHALDATNASNLLLDNFIGTAAHPERYEAIRRA